MKAFQLKIVIKNSKPPIWRRVIVPAGITFSQLSIILNEVMGWCGYHLFEFEFYHREIRFVEGADEFDIGYGPFDDIEASTAYIREYLEENDWFTYTYDLGDNWEHRVTIEKILDHYENEYPQVIKYKGNCPVEDCGGIWGYYQNLEIIEDPANPEYEDMLSWMESQGYPKEYDMESVNQKLKKVCFYKWGRGENRCQGEIYEEHISGKYGLNATKKDVNRTVKGNQSGKHKLNETMQMLVDAMDYQVQWDSMMKNITLADIFNDFTKKNIMECVRAKRIKGLTGRNKGHLIEGLVENMLEPEIMRPYFICMQENEIEEFEKAANAGALYESENIERLLKLYEAGYIGLLSDGRVTVPADVASAYRRFDREAFWEDQRKMSYLLCCLDTLGCLYGIAPMSILMQLIERNPSIQMEEEEIRENISCIPPEYSQFVVVDDMVYHVDLYTDDGGLQEMQGDKEFYIPTLREIMDYGTVRYDTNCEEGRQLKHYLIKRMGVESEEAEYVRGLVQIHIAGGGDMEGLIILFEELGIEPPNKKYVNILLRHISNLWNHTRMILNRGFTPNELSSTVPNPALTLSKRGNVIDFETIRKQKVYPNDPCPCGSGKKYKNCCRDKES